MKSLNLKKGFFWRFLRPKICFCSILFIDGAEYNLEISFLGDIILFSLLKHTNNISKLNNSTCDVNACFGSNYCFYFIWKWNRQFLSIFSFWSKLKTIQRSLKYDQNWRVYERPCSKLLWFPSILCVHIGWFIVLF